MKVEHRLIPTGEFKGYGAEPANQHVFIMHVSEDEYRRMVKPVPGFKTIGQAAANALAEIAQRKGETDA